MREVLKGNYAIAYAVKQANVDFIPVYPITPQTSIIEKLAEFTSIGELRAKYVPMESEHSVMAACIGASLAGARVFTATSGQGLLYMHELLHWASGSRLPIVMGVVNRAVAPGWNIWMDQSDTTSQRDTGWIQIYTTNHQEVYDHLFIAYRIAEKVLLPVMVIQDAFFLSHTISDLTIEDDQEIKRFIQEKKELPFGIDFSNPRSIGSLSDPSNYMEFRKKIQDAFENSENEIENIYKEFEETFGRHYEVYEDYRAEDAEYIIATSGTLFENSCIAVDSLRSHGIKAGSLKIRFLRPFFKKSLIEKIRGKITIVIDRNYSFGKGGVFAEEIRTVYNDNVYSVIAGLGGRDVPPKTIEEIVKKTLKEKKDYWEMNVYV